MSQVIAPIKVERAAGSELMPYGVPVIVGVIAAIRVLLRWQSKRVPERG